MLNLKPSKKRFIYSTTKVFSYFGFSFLESVEIHPALCICPSVSARANDVNNTESHWNVFVRIRSVVNRSNQDTTVNYGLIFCAFSWPYLVKWHNSGIINRMMTRNPSWEVFGAYNWSTKSLLNYHLSAKFCRNAFSNLLEKRNRTAILLILIPEYSQSNATLVVLIEGHVNNKLWQQIFGKVAHCSWKFCKYSVYLILWSVT